MAPASSIRPTPTSSPSSPTPTISSSSSSRPTPTSSPSPPHQLPPSSSNSRSKSGSGVAKNIGAKTVTARWPTVSMQNVTLKIDLPLSCNWTHLPHTSALSVCVSGSRLTANPPPPLCLLLERGEEGGDVEAVKWKKTKELPNWPRRRVPLNCSPIPFPGTPFPLLHV